MDNSSSRTVGWFSAGAASAIACRIAQPDVIAYCDTGSEHDDNHRFIRDCERAFGWSVTMLRNDAYADTMDVWEKRRYMSGVAGAPCTGLLKVVPRQAFQRPDDIHVFGYTADSRDMQRAEAMGTHWPDLTCRFPLIERGITKAACRAMLETLGVAEPITYAQGFENANCLKTGCVKATSPDYWSLYRREYPDNFARTAALARRLGARLSRIEGERVFIDDIPDDWPVAVGDSPACDFLCQLAEQDLLQ